MDFLVVGLGNPGAKYENTPHNLGFKVIDRLALSKPKNVVLAKPQTFMNLSGPAVKSLLERYELTPGRLILVYDELALPWKAIRVRPKGSDAGHNGVKSVIGSLGTNEFPRVRLGIRPDHPIGDGAKFVLGPFKKAQMQEVDEMVAQGCAAIESIIADGVEKSMTMFNRRAGGLKQEEE
ncbi:MAG: aminoacyl-tRNA hydrolase [Bryobacteraceae bacterium]